MIRPARTVVFAAASLAVLSTASAEGLPGPLRAALDARPDGPAYAYEMTLELEDMVARGIVDATKPEGERIKVLSPAKEDWPEEFADGLAEMDAAADGDIWCNDFGDNVPDMVDLVEETDKTATYSFEPVPDPDADSNERKAMKNLVATITVDKLNPAVLAFSMRAPKPFKPAFVAKVNLFDMDITCARAPDGRTYEQAMSFAIEGSALGQSFSERTRREITKLLPAAGE